jgi:class 3 adenylate cyclase/predicted ATPase
MTIFAEPGAPVATHEESEFLRPYVPRLVIDWLRTDAAALHREVEASLVFVDISGFTALTERLARKGKVGAELMRDTLDGVFTALLDEAYDWGAGLLKWGGDALLLMFDGPDHAWRACRAAWEMQRTIERVGRFHVAGATNILRMSIGIGTGRYQFFMTGSVHRELLIAGPAMTETLAMEAIADAGEIGISPAVVSLLPRTHIGLQKDGITLLGGPPEVERRRAPEVGGVRDLDIASCIPVAARAHVLLKRSVPEHRTITAAFIDLMDTDRLLAYLGPEALGRALDERMRSIQEAALRYGVPFYETDVGKSSVKALLTAGAPSSTGHDEERMLRTLRDIMSQRGIVQMRIGVNTGKVFTGDFGPPYRRAYRVFGDAINTAARVMSKAEAGQILSTEIVLDRSRTVFDTTPIPPFAAKGKAEPVRASIVGPAIGTKAKHRGGVALTGRDEELRVLLDAVARARDGRGSIVEVAGLPGTGKTRLIEEVIVRCPDFRPVTARCEEYEASTPYFPFRALLRDVLGVGAATESDEVVGHLRAAVQQLDVDLVPWIPLIGILLGVDLPDTPETAALDDRFLRDRLSEVAIRFLGATQAGMPTLVIIEDAQYLDEASQDLFLRLSKAASDRRGLLVVTHEGHQRVFPPEDEGAEAITIDLAPLPVEVMSTILELATDDDPLRPHEIEKLARRSGGNPLFLFQLLDTVRATGTIEALPDSIEALIAGEIDRLAPNDRTILRFAAVLGTSFDPQLLVDCVRDEVDLDDEVWTRLGEILPREPNGELRFRSTLMRDAAYEGLPYRRRRALHGRVAEAIEAAGGETLDEQVGILAFHYTEAQRWDKAWRFCKAAGERASAVYANVEASRFYDKAIQAGKRLRSVGPTELAKLYELTSDAMYRLGEFSAADRELQAARRLVRADSLHAGEISVKQAMISTRLSDYPQALARVRHGLRALDGRTGSEASATRARLMVQLAVAKFLQNRRVESIGWCRRAVQEAKRGRARDALATAYKILDGALLENGEIEKAKYSSRALAIYEELGDLRNQSITLNNMGLIAHDRSHWDESRQTYERALGLAEVIGDRSTAALIKYNISEILIDQGRLDEAAPLIREVIRVWRASGAEADVAEANRELAKLLSRRGDYETARRLLDAARAEQVHTGKDGEILRTDVRIAEILVIAGQGRDALSVIEAAARRAEATDGGSTVLPMLARLRGLAMMQRGDRKAAEASLLNALRTGRRRADIYETALALDGLVAIGREAGRDITALESERQTLFDQLGIVWTPEIQLEVSDEAIAAG